jgi:hypothetical protein
MLRFHAFSRCSPTSTRDSALFGRFVTGTRLADAFEGSCPATFRTEYLPPGGTPHCIDFILTADGVKAESATVAFAGKEPLPGGPGYVSDPRRAACQPDPGAPPAVKRLRSR